MIRVAGPDRVAFLQGQLTQDLREVTPRRSAMAGWATAQGRLLLVTQVFAWRDALWLTAPAATCEALAGRLRRFVMRSQVTVDTADPDLIGLLDGGSPWPGPGDLASDPLACLDAGDWLAMRVAGDPARVLLAGRAAAFPGWLGKALDEAAPADDWALADIRAGIPLIAEATLEAFIPQMVNLDLLGGVHFSKGCYSGQEIVTRTRHLGRVKRRMLRFACPAREALPPGAPVFAAGRPAGEVVASTVTEAGCELLAVTGIGDGGLALHADADGARPLTRLALPYAVPEAP